MPWRTLPIDADTLTDLPASIFDNVVAGNFDIPELFSNRE